MYKSPESNVYQMGTVYDASAPAGTSPDLPEDQWEDE